MSESTIEFIDRLVEQFPVLEPILTEHLADNFGEVLPHMFLGDLTRFILAEWAQRSDPGAVQPILDGLEEAFCAGDDEISELIAVSFLENLPPPGGAAAGIRRLLGPQLGSELERIG